MFESLQRLVFAALLILIAIPVYCAIETRPPHPAPPQLLQAEQFSSDDVRFQSRGRDYVTYFTSSGLMFAGFTAAGDGPLYFELGMQLVGAQKDVDITTLNPMLASNDQWLTNLPDYARIKYGNVYPGIDMICYGIADQVEMQFMVAAGGNVGRIRIRLTENTVVEPTPDGGLRLMAGAKSIHMTAPTGYQVDATGIKQTIDAHYVVNSNKEISLSVGAFDPKRPLFVLNP
jgi:hypothetical protein